MQKCTIMNNEKLTSFKYSIWAFCEHTVFIEPKDDTTCFSSNNDVELTVKMGHLDFVYGIDVGDVKRKIHNLGASDGSMFSYLHL